MREAAAFFIALLNLPVPRIAIENPIMHYHARDIIGVRHTQTIQPWQFGHGECKRTCLWLKNLPPLVSNQAPLYVASNVVEGREQRIHRLPPSADRWKLRSLTYPGIAEAMAEQYGSL